MFDYVSYAYLQMNKSQFLKFKLLHLPENKYRLAKVANLQQLFKFTKTKSLFKKRIKTKAKNYRPISLFPLISKVIKKSIHDQTQGYLQRNGLLYIYQSDFRANHFTNTCLFRLTDMIINGAENRKLTGMILNDLQKAFDTLFMKFFKAK